MVARIGIAHHALRLVAAATTALLLLSGTASAQLALSGNMPVAGTGIPFGATGLDSPGLSPAPTGNGMMCSAAGNSSSGVSGTSTIYDGGGIGVGASSLASSATCGMTSGASSAATLAPPPAPSSISRSGIPLGSFEINNAGVSPSVVVPAPSVSMPTSLPPPTIGGSMPCSITGSSMPSTPC
jgi:hypothetical protein